MAQKSQKEAFIMGYVVPLCALLALFILFFCTPYSLYLLGILIAIFVTRKSNSIILKAANRLLLPIAIGIGLFCVVYFTVVCLEVFSPSTLYGYEQKMVDFRLKTRSWMNLSIFKLIGVLLLLLLVAFVIPAYKPLSKTLKWYKYFQNATIIMAIVSSFTFFAQQPADHLVEIERQERFSKYEVLLRQGQEEVGRYIAALSIQEEIERFTPKERRKLRGVFDSIQTLHTQHNLLRYANGSYLDVRSEFVNEIATQISNQGKPIFQQAKEETEKKLEQKQEVFEKVLSFADKLKQLKILQKQEAFNSRSEMMADEVIKAIEISFIHIIDLKGIEAQYLGESFIRKLIQLYTKQMFNTFIVKKMSLERKLKTTFDQYFEKPLESLFFTKNIESGKSGLAINSPLTNINRLFKFAIKRKEEMIRQKTDIQVMINRVNRIKATQESNNRKSGFGSNKSTRSYGG